MQVLYERGMHVVGMKGAQTEGRRLELEFKNKLEQIVPPHLDAHAVLSKCPDFANEKSALQKIVEDRGHLLLPSVICHPECAGGGIEYAWGKLKYEWRCRNAASDKRSGGKVFIDAVKDLFVDDKVLPMSRVFKFARRARDYIRLYASLDTSLTFEEIETQRKKYRTHRNVMEIDRRFIQQS
jgi:hypothetical protein